MLQQVLKDMYIDPDLLAELDEESKQILFCKMREEQVRRWKEREEKLEKEESKQSKKSKNKKNAKKTVQFLMAVDGNPWVWVMGEHKDDLTIEQILEQEAKEKAEQEALKEMEKLQKIEEEKLAKLLHQEQEKAEREKRDEEEKLRKQAEKTTNLETKNKILQQIEENKKKLFKNVQRKIENIKRASINSIIEVKEKRSSEILCTLKEMKEKQLKAAEQNQSQLEAAWKEQERKAKEAEAEKRAIARKAREEHHQSLKADDNVISSLMNMCDRKPEKQPKPTIKPRPAKPPNRAAVIKWFQEEEVPRGSGLDPQTNQVAPWFHGIITRQLAEDMLEDKKPGTFLIRVSEKIYGYAVSLRSPVNCKHFLISVSPAGYKFFGTNQILHPSLHSLVKFHQDKYISAVGQEKLQYPCGQSSDPPDTEELFANCKAEMSHL